MTEITPKEAHAAASLAGWIQAQGDLGEVVVLTDYGRERFRVRWDRVKGLKITFPEGSHV